MICLTINSRNFTGAEDPLSGQNLSKLHPFASPWYEIREPIHRISEIERHAESPLPGLCIPFSRKKASTIHDIEYVARLQDVSLLGWACDGTNNLLNMIGRMASFAGMA